MLATVISITPTVSTSAYTTAYQLGTLNDLSAALPSTGGQAIITSVTLVDAASQNAAIDVLFFRDKPTVTSSDNTALDISAAEMKSKFLGAVSLASASYKALAHCSYVCATNVQLMVDAAAGKTDLWVILQVRGTPTYVTSSDLELRIGIAQIQEG